MNAPASVSALGLGWAWGHRRWTALLLLGCSSLLASAQPTNTPARLDYSAFKIIPERNIFNPHRYARSSAASRPRETRRVARVESCVLVGVMNYEKGPFAFFDGTSSDYRKVLKPEGSIAGYKLAEVKPTSVLLAAGTNTLELRVGMQLRREDEGQWQVAAAPELPPLSPPPAYSPRLASAPMVAQSTLPAGVSNAEPQAINFDPAAQSAAGEPPALAAEGIATNAAPDAVAGGSDDPVLRRLMQRREQEMNR